MKTTNNMKYNSKIAEHRVCKDFNSELKNKLNKHATEQSGKLFDLSICNRMGPSKIKD